MKRKKTKLLLTRFAIILLLILTIPIVRNRLAFGVWNPKSLPNRIQCFDRTYYIGPSSPQTMNGIQKPAYEVSHSDNRTGKDLYTSEPKEEQVPVVLYLKCSDGRYQQYSLSGGP